MDGLLDNAITRLTVRTAWGPDIVLDKPFAPSAPSPLLALLKPQIFIETDFGPLKLAPYGAPPPTKWPYLAGAVLGLAGFGAYFLISRIFAKRRAARGLSGVSSRRRLGGRRGR